MDPRHGRQGRRHAMEEPMRDEVKARLRRHDARVAMIAKHAAAGDIDEMERLRNEAHDALNEADHAFFQWERALTAAKVRRDRK